MRASRRRHAPGFEPFPDQAPPVEVKIVEEKLDDQIARSILEARTIGFALQRLGNLARPELAWRCTKLGTLIITELAELFPDKDRR